MILRKKIMRKIQKYDINNIYRSLSKIGDKNFNKEKEKKD